MYSIIRLPVLALAFLFFMLAWFYTIPSMESPRFRFTPESRISPTGVFEEHWVSRGETTEAHSANITMLNGAPVAVWYGGTEEGARDVALYLSRFGEAGWSTPAVITDRIKTEAGLHRSIRKIGNPTLHAWPDGSLGVFYVTVSIGGWAASSINYMESADMGDSWGRPKRLVTSPFLNISTLVRSTLVTLEDGSVLLPVYHEFAGKFGELLRLTRNLDIVAKTRISSGRYSLQPTIAAIDKLKATALLRYAGDPPNRVLLATTNDGGLSWSDLEKLALPNPNSAIAIVNPGNGFLLAALNDTKDGRHRLSLAVATVGGPRAWKVVRTIEQGNGDASHEVEYSYPSMAIAADGSIHLVYTWNQERIKHVRFNQTWVMRGR